MNLENRFLKIDPLLTPDLFYNYVGYSFNLQHLSSNFVQNRDMPCDSHIRSMKLITTDAIGFLEGFWNGLVNIYNSRTCRYGHRIY